jgi:hypothetical protein
LFLGRPGDLASCGIADHEHVRPRAAQLAAITPLTGVLMPNEANAWSDGDEHPCILEAMKDGVKIRSINSALNSDSVVVIRPLLDASQVGCAMAQALMHEGKAYDFDFNFGQSHRLVCTEVVYRAYEGVGGIQFNLRRHVGRFALAASELVSMALEKRHFELVAVYSPAHAATVQSAEAAIEVIRRVQAARAGAPPPSEGVNCRA